MRKYSESVERMIRLERLLREWTRSGLIGAAQRDRLESSLQIDLRRTNLWLRGILFSFGLLIIGATVAFLFASLDVTQETTSAIICLVSGAGCVLTTEFLIARVRLYRFGIEEAAAIGFVVLTAIGALIGASSLRTQISEFPEFVGLTAGAFAALAVYRRYGYVYAAIAAMLCAALAPFQTAMPYVAQRMIPLAILAGLFVLVRSLRLAHGNEFPGGEYATIQAVVWITIYAFLNLQLLSRWFAVDLLPGAFYWATYGAIWILPAIGLWLAIRDKDRPLLDASLVMVFLTLLTNKPYLSMTRQPWDPILLGLLSIGVAVAVRRWLAIDRYGFTASRTLSSDDRQLSVVGTASTALPAPAPHHQTVQPDTFEPGGGRSGGAGASGSF